MGHHNTSYTDIFDELDYYLNGEYAPLLSQQQQHPTDILSVHGITTQEYAKQQEEAIRFMRILPESYLSKEKAEKVVQSIQTGRDPGNGLLEEAAAAANSYKTFLQTSARARTRSSRWRWW
ncbi:hypothetical protein [Mollivirus kamchatka]|nr:hypothetical protein [Mollivirus kamchatka]